MIRYTGCIVTSWMYCGKLYMQCLCVSGMNEMPRLETVENCMKVSQMMTQALEAKSSPLQQLPHIRPDMMRHFITRKVPIYTHL